MAWTVLTLNATVDKELAALPVDMQARFQQIAGAIRQFGLQAMHEPQVKHLRGPLWEIRMRGKDGISRALYVTASGQRVVVVRVFVKKTQKTPGDEIALAMKRAKEIEL